MALLLAILVTAHAWYLATYLATAQAARPPDASRPHGRDEAANLLFRVASFAKSSRTVAGLEEAAGKFGTPAREHPEAAAAHARLAQAWLLMREFGRLPGVAAGRRARIKRGPDRCTASFFS